MNYPCLDCGKLKCTVKDSYCKTCLESTVRTIRVPMAEILAGDVVVKDLPAPGESIEAEYFDQGENERVIVVKKFLN